VDADLRAWDRDTSACFRTPKDPFGAFSNFARHFPFEIEGARIPSSEALYQAMRFTDRPDIQNEILTQATPAAAKACSRSYQDGFGRIDWLDVRVEAMDWCLRVKVLAHGHVLGEVLDATRDLDIVEESGSDQFWGAIADANRLVGHNWLGRLWMQIRAERNVVLPSVQPPDIGLKLWGIPVGELTSDTVVAVPGPLR
jgi:ribA/ribD-fused uncharacterized protein